MALTRPAKVEQVAELTQKFQKATSVIFTHYLGLTVSDVSALRRSLREKNAEMKVAKKTLIQLAAKNAGLPEITDQSIPGGIACVFSFGDPIAGAQTTFQFGKENKSIKLVAGIFDGKILSEREAVEFASIPSRDVLLATFMSMVRSPLSSFASMVSSPLRGFAMAVQEIAKKKS